MTQDGGVVPRMTTTQTARSRALIEIRRLRRGIASLIAIATVAAGAAVGMLSFDSLTQSVHTCRMRQEHLASGKLMTFSEARVLLGSRADPPGSTVSEEGAAALREAIGFLEVYYFGADADLAGWFHEHSMRLLSAHEVSKDPAARALLERMEWDIRSSLPPLIQVRQFLFENEPYFNRAKGVVDTFPNYLIAEGRWTEGGSAWQAIPAGQETTWLAAGGVGGRVRFSEPMYPLTEGEVVVQVAVNIEFIDGLRCPLHMVLARQSSEGRWRLVALSIANDCDTDHTPPTI